jgi:hypothetical protein
MTMANVTIFHKMGESLFRPYASGDPLAKRYDYDKNFDLATEYKHRERILSEVWRENNVVTGDELPTQYSTRSLSVGDVFVITYNSDSVVEAWCVEVAGFEPVLLEDLWSSQVAWDELKEEAVHA